MKPSRRSLGVLGAVLLGMLLAALLAVLASPPTGDRVVAKAPPARGVAAVPPVPAMKAPMRDPAVAAPARAKGPAIDLEWADPDRHWFAVDVVTPDGRAAVGAAVHPISCKGFAYDTNKRLYVASPGTCIVQAVRRDGALFARSKEASITLTGSASPGYLQVELEETRTGGIGVRFRPTADGMQVLSLVEGGPAWEAGLEVGDLIVSVNGEDVGGIENTAFVERMTGPEGSKVEFEVRYSDPESPEAPVFERVQVVRQFLEG